MGVLASCDKQEEVDKFTNDDYSFSRNFKIGHNADEFYVCSLEKIVCTYTETYENEDTIRDYSLYFIKFNYLNTDYNLVYFVNGIDILVGLPVEQVDVWKEYEPRKYAVYTYALENGATKVFTEDEGTELFSIEIVY